MIHVTVARDGVAIEDIKFDDNDAICTRGGVQIVLRGAVKASQGAPVWQRVAHAATVVAYTQQALDEFIDENDT